MKMNAGWAAVCKSGWLASDLDQLASQNRHRHSFSGVSRFDFFAQPSIGRNGREAYTLYSLNAVITAN